jgi:septum formation protein
MKLVVATHNQDQIKLLKQISFDPIRVDPRADLSAIADTNPSRLAIAQALAQARSVREKFKQSIVLSTASIMTYRNKIISQPTFKMDALELLKQFSGSSHLLVTGWGLYNTATRAKRQGSAQTKITFKKVSAQTLLDYVNDYDVVKMIGCYDINHTPAIHFVSQIHGSLTNVTHQFPLDSILPTLVKQVAQ